MKAAVAASALDYALLLLLSLLAYNPMMVVQPDVRLL